MKLTIVPLCGGPGSSADGPPHALGFTPNDKMPPTIKLNARQTSAEHMGEHVGGMSLSIARDAADLAGYYELVAGPHYVWRTGGV